MSAEELELLAALPLEQRTRAARKVIVADASLDADGRRVLLAVALWPTDVMAEPPPRPEPPREPWEPRPCKGCGVTYTPRGVGQLYCCRRCRVSTWRTHQRAAPAIASRHGLV